VDNQKIYFYEAPYYNAFIVLYLMIS